MAGDLVRALQTQLRAAIRRYVRDVLTVKTHPSAVGLNFAAQLPDGGGLARAIGADERVDFAPFDRKRQPIGCGHRTSLNEIVKLLNELSGEKKVPKIGLGRKGDVKHSLADITLAEEIIGFKPRVSFQEGLDKAIDWYRNNLI